MKIAHFSICSRNYLAYALTLRSSLKKADPDAEFFIVLCDEVSDDLATDDAIIIGGEDLGMPDYWSMSAIYNVMEFNTALKPFALQYFFDRGYEAAIYIDPDIYVKRKLSAIYSALLDGAPAVLTPHLRFPYNDDLFPSEVNIMQTGIYNLGFGAFTNTERCRVFVDWWADMCVEKCIDALEEGLFVDQKFCDLVPAWVPGTAIIDHPGYNAAYWNLHERPVTKSGEDWFADEQQLHFFHFSGVIPGDHTTFSKHQDRFQVESIGDLKELLEEYLDQLERSGQETFSSFKYKYDYLVDGSRIPQEYRLLFREEGISSTDAKEFFKNPDHERFALADRRYVDPALQDIPRLLGCIYDRRGDVRAAFPLSTADGRAGLINWFFSSGAKEHRIPDPGIEACRNAVERSKALVEMNRLGLARFAGYEPPLRSNEAICDQHPENQSQHLPFDEMPSWIKWANRVTRPVLPQEARRKLFLQSAATERPSAKAETLVDSIANETTKAVPSCLPDSGSRNRLDCPAVGYFGYVNAETGVGEGARRAINSLRSADVDVWVQKPTGGRIFANPSPFEIDREPEVNPHPISVFHINADETCALTAKVSSQNILSKYRIGFWAWELPRLPEAWKAATNFLDEIWVPSEFVKRAVETVTDKPVNVMPHPVVVAPADPDRKRFGIPPESTAILMTFDFNSYASRKNPAAAIRAFEKAFSGRSDVSLVVKCHGDGKSAGQERVALEAKASKDPRIVIIDQVLTRKDMDVLQESCDAFLSLHRSEGFGLNIIEMMARSKPVIATAFSGNADFLNLETGFPVRFGMTPVRPGEYPFGEGQYWAKPSIDSASDKLKSLLEDPNKAASRAAAGSAFVRQEFSTEAVGLRMQSRLCEIGKLLALGYV